MKCFKFSLMDLGCQPQASGTQFKCHSLLPFLPGRQRPPSPTRTAARGDAVVGTPGAGGSQGSVHREGDSSSVQTVDSSSL